VNRQEVKLGQWWRSGQYVSEAGDEVTVNLSPPAATFLLGTVEALNEKKILPPGNAAALQTSAWLEEIEAQLRAALEDKQPTDEQIERFAEAAYRAMGPLKDKERGPGQVLLDTVAEGITAEDVADAEPFRRHIHAEMKAALLALDEDKEGQ
jgi:hypothetical protein